jgi:hypothetical protein
MGSRRANGFAVHVGMSFLHFACCHHDIRNSHVFNVSNAMCVSRMPSSSRMVLSLPMCSTNSFCMFEFPCRYPGLLKISTGPYHCEFECRPTANSSSISLQRAISFVHARRWLTAYLE